MEQSLEQLNCGRYLERSHEEADFDTYFPPGALDSGLIVAEGFEERSVGILEACVARGFQCSKVIIGRYTDGPTSPNAKYRPRFDEAAKTASRQKSEIIDNMNDGKWVRAALDRIEARRIILDITGISNRGLFAALDIAVSSGREVFIAYSEAGEYWPKKKDWESLEARLADPAKIADIVDEQPWLFGPAHRVEYVPGHEGYDSAGAGRALVAFLPYKAARLAAVLGEEDYAAFLYIAGKPRLPTNEWRLKALKTINSRLTKAWPVVSMDTFGYRSAFQSLVEFLLAGTAKSEPLLSKYNVHLAIMGSKLQNIACWAFSSMVPAVTIVTAVPKRYFPEAFSEGIGTRWIFPLTSPKP